MLEQPAGSHNMAAFTPSLQQNIGFRITLQSVKPHSPAETVQAVWQIIVSEWFPGRQGYRPGFKSPTLVNNNNVSGFTRVQVKALAENPPEDWDERQILLVECNPPSSNTASSWHDTIIGQFREDLSQNLSESGRLFGALAVGKKVRFYQFDGKASPGQTLVQLHQDTLDLEDPSDIVQVENMLSYIKENAWQWASL